MSVENMLAAATPYINEAVLPMEAVHDAMQQMGVPTDRIRGTHINELQRMARTSNGHRQLKIQRSLQNTQNHNATRSGSAGVARGSGSSGAAVARGSGSSGVAARSNGQHHQSSSPVQAQTPPWSPPTVKGVETRRTVKRILHYALKGTPNTQSLAEDVYNDVLTGARSTAMGYMQNAEDEDEPEENEEGEAPSQQVADATLLLKKLERKRKSEEK